MENCTFGEHPAVLVKLKLLANIAIYWPIPNLANKSEQLSPSSPHFNNKKECTSTLKSVDE
jgi:hypothetical protein